MTLPPLPESWLLLRDLGAGLMLGLLHFGLLRWNTALYVRGVAWALPVQLLRMALLLLLLLPAARAGFWHLLLVLLGLMAGRALLLRRMRTT